MTMHELMQRWARETYSPSNSEVERKTFSECLSQVRDLSMTYLGEDPAGLLNVLAIDWDRESRAPYNANQEREIYAVCLEQLKETVSGVVP